jgi:hypothetical protein
MSKDGFYGSGGAAGAPPIGGGVGSIWGKLTLLELNQNKILSRLYQLENGCDAGEPVNKYYTACLEKNARELTEANAYWEDLCQKLQTENADLRWRFDNPNMVEKQTARKCLSIVSKIKNEPLTTMSPSREWMVAICEDIERVIKQEFDLK